MSPQELTALTHAISLIGKLSEWPFGLMLFLFVLGPWITMMFIAYGYKKRFEEVVRMYENNVKLLERTQELLERTQELTEDMKEIVIMNTRAVQKMFDAIENNRFCPMIRLEKQAVGSVG